MVFHWSLSDSKSPQVSRTLLSILAILNNTVVWMVSTCLPTSKSSSSFSNPLVTVPNAPITIGIIVTCMFHCFFNSLARSRYLSFFSHSFCFILWSAGTAKRKKEKKLLYKMVSGYFLWFWIKHLYITKILIMFVCIYIYIYIYIYKFRECSCYYVIQYCLLHGWVIVV